MTSDAQRATNRANAKNSTGPRTGEGKTRSAMNALRHGGYANRTDAITASILEEDPDVVKALIDAIVDELDPQTPFEQITDETVAARTLNRMRVDRLTAPLAEGLAPIRGQPISPDSHQYQYQYGVSLHIALVAIEGNADADCKVDWCLLIGCLQVLEPSGRGFDSMQSRPDGMTRPQPTRADPISRHPTEAGPERKVGENLLVPLAPATWTDCRGRSAIRTRRRSCIAAVPFRARPGWTVAQHREQR